MATKKSRLHIPRPTARPGDQPDFRYLDLAEPGSVDKPSISARTRDIEYLSSGLVRILDDEHHAVGPWNPDLDPAKLQVALRWMLLNRHFDKRMWQIQRQGRISFYMEAKGEEAVSIGAAMALRSAARSATARGSWARSVVSGIVSVSVMLGSDLSEATTSMPAPPSNE